MLALCMTQQGTADDPVQLECSINTQDMSFYVNYIYN